MPPLRSSRPPDAEALERTIASYDRVAGGYADHWFGRRLMAADLDRFLALLPPGGRILDAGCGPGRDAAYMAERGFEVLGIDLSPGMLQQARRRVPSAVFELRDLRQEAPELRAGFHGVWACASLVHVARSALPATLQALQGALTPGGHFYASLRRGRGERFVASRRAFGTVERFFAYYLPGELHRHFLDARFDVVWHSENGRWLALLAVSRRGVSPAAPPGR